MSAIRAYITSEDATKEDGKYTKHGSTFFNQWEDYVPQVPVVDADAEKIRRRRSITAALKFNRDADTGLSLTEEQRNALTKELEA